MKRLGQLMSEMGFNKDASEGAKEAFIKHLIRASEGVNVTTPTEKREMAANPQKIVELPQPIQLSFEFANSPTQSKKNPA